MCRFPASGSSWESLARGGVDDTIRDPPADAVAEIRRKVKAAKKKYQDALREKFFGF
jgi:hypothetical protein